MRYRRYIEWGVVSLVIPQFSVVKAQIDIRVVWDSRSNGHNETLWAPDFMLDDFGDLMELVVKWLPYPVTEYFSRGRPTQDYTLPASTFIKTIQADIDVGEQVPNFCSYESNCASLGVRLYQTRGEHQFEPQEFWRFCTLHFGGVGSPYFAVQGQRRILEHIKGDRHDASNHWQWESVRLNLPGSDSYDPSMPRVMLLTRDGKLALREVKYVDGIHPCMREREGEDKVMVAAKQLKSGMNSQGNQADDKKYHPADCLPRCLGRLPCSH